MEENKKKFITQLVIFLIFSLIAPIIYITIRFDLVNTTKNISLWGLVIILLVIGVSAFLIKYYLDGVKTKYSFLKKFLTGFVKVIIPLGIALAITIFIYLKADEIMSQMATFIEAISVIIGCELIAIVINPLPKWAFDNNVEGLVQICDKIFHREESEEKKEGE